VLINVTWNEALVTIELWCVILSASNVLSIADSRAHHKGDLVQDVASSRKIVTLWPLGVVSNTSRSSVPRINSIEKGKRGPRDAFEQGALGL
jgi:hypothetical protein